MFYNFRKWLAGLICPELNEELLSLRSSNTKLLLKSVGEERYIRGK